MSQTDRLRLLAGKIANLHWKLDRMSEKGQSEYELGPLRHKVNTLLVQYQQACAYYDCSHKEFVDDEADEPFVDFYFCR